MDGLDWGDVVAKFGRGGWLPAPKPAGGALAYGSELRGVDCVAEEFDDELEGKLDEPCDEEGCDADRGRDEPGSVTCDELLGAAPVFRGGSVTELDGSCPAELCEDEGCRKSFDDGRPDDEDGCDGRGAAVDGGVDVEGCDPLGGGVVLR